MKNKLIDLNNHLFAQLERLSDENLTKEKLAVELERSKGIKEISREIIANAQLALDAQIQLKEYKVIRAPEMLGYIKDAT